ncbi:MAG: hypothetical protein ABL876_00080 [Chitinophagaceae bacterium]
MTQSDYVLGLANAYFNGLIRPDKVGELISLIGVHHSDILDNVKELEDHNANLVNAIKEQSENKPDFTTIADAIYLCFPVDATNGNYTDNYLIRRIKLLRHISLILTGESMNLSDCKVMSEMVRARYWPKADVNDE